MAANRCPAPHPRLANAVYDTPDMVDPVTLARSFEAGESADVAPSPPSSYTPPVQANGDALYRPGTLPGSGQVRPEYANAGRWLTQP